MKKNNIISNKVSAAARIMFAELIPNIPPLGFFIPLLFALIASVLEDGLADISKSYINMSMIVLCFIEMAVYRNILTGNGVMRKTTLPMTHSEKFFTLMLCTLITIAAWILFIGIAGAVIFAITGSNIFNLSVTDSLLCFMSQLISVKMLVYFFYMAMLLLLTVALCMPKNNRKRKFIELISMFILFIACVIAADVITMPWISIAYMVLAIIVCIVESYRNIKNIESI